jgi:two-component system OmpR family sensor kinase
VVTTLNKEEKNALIKFLFIYMLSATILIGMIAFLYYKKEVVAIDDKCSMEMTNAALLIEKELMHAHMEGLAFEFNPKVENLHVGLFGTDGSKIHSNLQNENILLSQKSYRSNTHEFHVDTLDMPVFGIKYIVIEGQEGFNEKFRLLSLIFIVSIASIFFVGFIGYLLSKMLIAPIKERIEKLNAFIKDSSHDLNTPVSALMMSVSSLKNKEKIDQRVLNHISISTKLISQIYNSLSYIAFNDRDEYMNEKFDLAELVKESVRFFDEIAGAKGNKIEVDLEQTFVFMDRSRIQKLINNLLSNAIKYSFSNTTINISLKQRVLSVQDRGIGISKEDEKAIFHRYERKSKDQGGFGIGLDIVSSVCKTYNIEIWIESKVGVGSTFYLRFPKRRA